MSTTNSRPAEGSFKESQDSHRAIMKSVSIISIGTLSSRILGFIRDVVLARWLGTGFQADAFFVAFRIPNLFRDLVGEGAMSAAIVPVLSEYKEKHDKAEFWNFVSVMLAISFIVLSALTLLGVFLTPWIVKLMAPGFMADPEKLELTVKLTRILFPYLILIGLTAYAMGILYTFRSFTVPAFSPCLLNIAMIVSVYLATKSMTEPILGLAWGVLAGGVLQLIVHVKPIINTGVRFQKPKSLYHPGVVKIGKLLIPRILGGGVYQLSVLLDTFCASLSSIVGAGGISAIYYANRIIQFPMGIFSVAIASAVLPTLSGFAVKKDYVSLRKTIVFSLENIFFIMCPTTVILLLFSSPIIRVLFQRGEFNLYSTDITSSALAYLSIGLFSFGGIKILVTAFYALQDTITPAKVAGVCLLINATLNFLLMGPLKVGGIALASSIAGTIDFLALLYILDKRLGGLNSGLLQYFFKVTFAACLTGIVEYWCWNYLIFGSETIRLIVLGSSGFVLFEGICLSLKIKQAEKVLEWIRNGFRIELDPGKNSHEHQRKN